MDARTLLVITGDFEVLQCVRRALNGDDVTVQAAYSPLDSAYLLQHQVYDAVLVDGALRDQRSGIATALTLPVPPGSLLLIYQMRGERPANRNGNTALYLDTLEEKPLRRTVLQALRMPLLTNGDSGQPRTHTGHLTQELALWRADEVQTLFALSRSLTEVLDLSEVLNRVVEAARYLTNADEGMILLPDVESGELYLRAKVGIETEVAQNFRVRTEDSIAGTVYSRGEPSLVGDSGPQKVKTKYFVNSLLYVPILLKGTPIGVLGVNNKDKHDTFTLRHQELLLNLASYAAIAIENAQVHGQIVEQAQELKALVAASERINASLKFEHALSTICEQLARVLRVTHTQLYTLDPHEHVLRQTAFFRRAAWRGEGEPKVNQSVVAIIEQGTTVFLAGDSLPATGDGMRAKYIVPVRAGEQSIGALIFSYLQPTPDTDVPPEALSQAQWQGLNLLTALHNPRNRSVRANLLESVEDLRQVFRAGLVELAALQPETRDWRIILSVGQGAWAQPPAPVLRLEQFPDVLAVIEQQEAINLSAESDDLTGSHRRLFQQLACCSLLALPLISRGSVIGLVTFADSERMQAFSTREIDLGRTLAGQAATAWENAELLRDLEDSLRKLQETQSRLIQTERLSAMGELAAAVAHQINNPLTTIVLDAELLLVHTPAGTPVYDSLTAIHRAGRRAAGVVHRLLASVRTNPADVPPEPVNINQSLEETLALVRSHIRRAKISLVSHLPQTPLPPVIAVPGELDDVWLNLLLNAHDALQGRPDASMGIEADYDAAAREIEVVVWDNGPGIPEDIQQDIFMPFFTTKPVGEGTGLGLHICRQVVERVGGTIALESASEQGTRFIVRLPAFAQG